MYIEVLALSLLLPSKSSKKFAEFPLDDLRTFNFLRTKNTITALTRHVAITATDIIAGVDTPPPLFELLLSSEAVASDVVIGLMLENDDDVKGLDIVFDVDVIGGGVGGAFVVGGGGGGGGAFVVGGGGVGVGVVFVVDVVVVVVVLGGGGGGGAFFVGGSSGVGCGGVSFGGSGGGFSFGGGDGGGGSDGFNGSVVSFEGDGGGGGGSMVLESPPESDIFIS